MSSQGPGTRLGLGSVAIAAGVAAAVGAAQLGVGYGLGVFSWLPTVDGGGDAAWLASLAWTVWISVLSVVLGAVVADRVGVPTVPWPTPVRALRRVALAVAAALGGLVVVALTAVPARVAERADTFAPHLIVGGYALSGVLLGLLVAIAALVARSVAVNILATGGWLWLLAVTATVDGIAAGRAPGVAQLGVWPVTADGPWFRSLYLPGAAIAAVSALVIGFLAALPAARRRDGQAGVVLSGAAGPALVAVAYLLAAPTFDLAEPEQLSAHLVAPYAVVTGLIGAVLALVLGTPRRARPANGGRTATVPPQPGPAAPERAEPEQTGSQATAEQATAPAASPAGKPSGGKPTAAKGAAAVPAKGAAKGSAAVPGAAKDAPPAVTAPEQPAATPAGAQPDGEEATTAIPVGLARPPRPKKR